MISSKQVDDILTEWADRLDSDEAWRAAQASDKLAEAFENVDTDYTVTVCDAYWNPIGTADDYISVSGTIPRNQAPQATLTLKGGHWLHPYLSNCKKTMVGVIIETEGVREAFYVKRHRKKMGEDGKVTLTSELVGIYDILNYLPIWPSWQLHIQAQPISHAIFAGPLCTVLEAAAAQCSLRIQSGIWEFWNNALSLNPDMRAWVGTMLQRLKSNGQMGSTLKTPLYVVRTGLLKDTSPVFIKTVRMTTVGQMITEITSAYGVDVRVNLWMPGMEQPDKWADLDRPTYVMTVKDRSQIEGPTKTVLDSVLRTIVDAEGSMFGKTFDPLLNPEGKYAPEGLYIAPSLGIDWVPPYAILITPDEIIADGEVVRDRSALVTYEIVDNTPLGWQHVIGGKSPKVCAPSGNWWGTNLRITQVAQRPHQRVAVLRHRRCDDHHRILRCAIESAGRVPERRVLRVPTHPALSAPRRRRPLPPRHRGLHPHQLVPVQPGSNLPVHPSALEQQGIHHRDSDVPRPERPLPVREGHLPRRPHDVGAQLPHRRVHRLHRAGLVQIGPQHKGTHRPNG